MGTVFTFYGPLVKRNPYIMDTFFGIATLWSENHGLGNRAAAGDDQQGYSPHAQCEGDEEGKDHPYLEGIRSAPSHRCPS